FQITCRIGDRPDGKFQTLGGCTHTAEGFFQSCGSEESERSQSRRADQKCVWFESGEKHTFPRFYLESFLPYIHVELPFQDVEEFVLARVYMGRWFSSRCQQCLHQEKGPVGILLFSEVHRQISVFPLG